MKVISRFRPAAMHLLPMALWWESIFYAAVHLFSVDVIVGFAK